MPLIVILGTGSAGPGGGGGGNADPRWYISAPVTVTTDLSLTTGAATNIVAGDFSSTFMNPSAQTATDLEIKFDFGAGQSWLLTGAIAYGHVSMAFGTWKWQGSDDDSSWTDIGSSFTLLTDDDNQINMSSQLSGNTTAYRYYRLVGVSGSVTGGFPMWEMLLRVGDDNETPPGTPSTAYVTGDRSGSITLAETIPETAGSDGVGALIDGDTTTADFIWSGTTTFRQLDVLEYIEFDWGASTERIIDEARFYMGAVPTASSEWIWFGQPDGETHWESIGEPFTINDTNFPDTTLTTDTTMNGNGRAYRKLRLWQYGGARPGTLEIREIEFKEATP